MRQHARYEVFPLCIGLKSFAYSFEVPIGEQDAPVRRSKAIILPLREIVIVIQPLIHVLAEVDFDLPPQRAVNWLNLVSFIGR